MAHEISINSVTGKEEAFYGSGTPAWHRLGTVIDGLATSDEALRLAGLDWEVEQQDLMRQGDGIRWVVETHVANVRVDTNEVLGVVGSKYTVVQNRDAFRFMDALVGEKLAMYDSAGALKGGRRVWLLAKIPKEYHITPEDKIQPYMLFANGHDGAMGLRVIPTAIRVVCNNTFSAALWKADGEGSGVFLKHTSGIMGSVESARAALGLAIAKFDAMDAELHRWLETPMTEGDAAKYFKKISKPLGRRSESDDDDPDAKERPSVVRLQELFHHDPKNQVGGMGGTLWGAFNAVTQWVDHDRGGRGSSQKEQIAARLDQAWFAVGATIKSNAIIEARRLAAV